MRILYSHYLAEDFHPAAQMVHAIADELRSQGHEIEVYRSRGPAGPERPQARTANGSSLRSRAKGAVWFAREMARNRSMFRTDLRSIERFRPDVILARQDAYCVSMSAAAARAGVPLVTYADAPVAYESRVTPHASRWHPPGVVEAIERWNLKQGRAIITVSQPAAARLKRYDLDRPIDVISNGVDPVKFPALSPEVRIQARRALGITANRVAGFVGSFKAFHGIDRLRDIINGVGPRPDTQWLLIGDGPEHGSIRASLADRDDVIFLGRRPAAEIGLLTALMDVAVVPHPKFQGDFYFCPLKVLEAAAAGCAVIASDQGDIPAILDEGKAGVILPAEGLSPWITAVSEALDHPERTTRIGRAARRHILSHYTWAETARKVSEVLERTVEQAERTPRSDRRMSRFEASREGIAVASRDSSKLLQPRFSS